MAVYHSHSAQETEKIGEELASQLPSRILALIGELGSGKTTFVKGLAKGLGIKKRILSPTFVFIRRYSISPRRSPRRIGGSTVRGVMGFLYHIDLYRLEKETEVKGLGLEEIFADDKNLVVIEWAEKIKKLLPKNAVIINFQYLDKNKRKIEIQ